MQERITSYLMGNRLLHETMKRINCFLLGGHRRFNIFRYS